MSRAGTSGAGKSSNASAAPTTSTPDDKEKRRYYYTVSEEDVARVHDALETKDSWFPSRVYSVFHKAENVRDVVTILTGRRLHPDDMTTLVILSERMKIMVSALVFVIIEYEKKKVKRNEMADFS